MPGNPNTSFIPKQGPVRRQRQSATRSVYIFTVIAYVTFSATLVASIGSFFYQRHIEAQLQENIRELNDAIAGFDNTKMNEVRSFNIKLAQARERLDNSASVESILTALEQATAQSVSLSSLEIERFGDTNLVVEAELETDTFDSSQFQRGVLEGSPIVDSVAVKELTFIEEAPSEDSVAQSGVSFIAEITIPVAEVPNIPAAEVPIAGLPQSISAPVDTEDAITESNEELP